MLAIDHVIVPVADLADAAAALETERGLASVEGGHHPTWGTANRIVPLGDTYVELVAVVDRSIALSSAFGTWIATATPGVPLGWVVRTSAIEDIGRRLGLTIVAGSRVTRGGEQITWRSAGLDVAICERGLPFFIQWGEGVPFPGAAPVQHPRGPARLTRLSLDADRVRLERWLGEHDLPLRVAPEQRMVVTLAQGDRSYDLAFDERLPNSDDDPPVLSDGAVTLRPWSADDAEFLAGAFADPDIRRYNGSVDADGYPGPPLSVADAAADIETFASSWRSFAATGRPTGAVFAITDALSGELIGCCGVDDWSNERVAQIGYWLAPGARGRGFATRAAKLLTSWLFGLGATRVFLTVVAGNEASMGVARRAGFAYEATLPVHSPWMGERFDVLRFDKLPMTEANPARR